MENRLRYRNEDDKSYGATGMAISLVAFDGEDLLVGMTIDNEPGEIMEMHSSFYFAGNPSLSAKSAWQQMRHNYSLSVAMLIGNVMCRWMVKDKEMVDPEIRKTLSERAIQEGQESLGLEIDEIRDLFDQEYAYLFKVFNHKKVHDIVHDFADTLRSRRSMSRMEIIELLRTLNVL